MRLSVNKSKRLLKPLAWTKVRSQRFRKYTIALITLVSFSIFTYVLGRGEEPPLVDIILEDRDVELFGVEGVYVTVSLPQELTDLEEFCVALITLTLDDHGVSVYRTSEDESQDSVVGSPSLIFAVDLTKLTDQDGNETGNIVFKLTLAVTERVHAWRYYRGYGDKIDGLPLIYATIWERGSIGYSTILSLKRDLRQWLEDKSIIFASELKRMNSDASRDWIRRRSQAIDSRMNR